MNSADLTHAAWRKSSRSNGQANCVETAALPDGDHAVRDSKRKSGPVLRFPASGWEAFIDGTKNGSFDTL
ncbi:DUF397 domain-containing protein [Streptomyces sp. AM 4-1-1]|uniref:DUF397 domain-containing protein n=1 Tax=unclassified Streptomyces TaxID=2593676 RepID=UPI0023B92AEB|nr:DUF397 domain-containing protein [Streptomyces sp. AM 4-1-1]WEH34705.1 DUF397 domain-containing protein [Streptomyces sp. AM 4-1-1]